MPPPTPHADDAEVERLAQALHAREPERDPLTIRFPDLERWLAEIAGPGARERPSPRRLEEIQARWHALCLAARGASR